MTMGGSECSHCNKSMKLSFCPFSAFLFASSAAAYTLYLWRKESKKLTGSNSNSSKGTTATTTTTTTTTTNQQQQPQPQPMPHPKFQVVFILGGPGSGKGTQCTLLSQQEQQNGHWSHLSAGDLLRAERQSGSDLAEIINQKIFAGQIVPSNITVTLLKNAMEKIYQTNQSCTKFLIDGFPRSEENCVVWDEVMSSVECELKFVLFLDCPEDVMTGRLLERAKTSGRNDDNLETIRKRFKTFREESMPIVEMYEKKGLLRKVVADCSVEDVYQEVKSLFEDDIGQ